MQHFERLKQKNSKQAHTACSAEAGYRQAKRGRSSAKKTRIDEREVAVMIAEGWSLHQVRTVTHDAILLGLLSGPPDYLARLNKYLVQHGSNHAQDDHDDHDETSDQIRNV